MHILNFDGFGLFLACAIAALAIYLTGLYRERRAYRRQLEAEARLIRVALLGGDE